MPSTDTTTDPTINTDQPDPTGSTQQPLTVREQLRRLDAWAARMPGWKRLGLAVLLCTVVPLFTPPVAIAYVACAIGLFLIGSGAYTYVVPAVAVIGFAGVVTGLANPIGGPLGLALGLGSGWLAFIHHQPLPTTPDQTTSDPGGLDGVADVTGDAVTLEMEPVADGPVAAATPSTGLLTHTSTSDHDATSDTIAAAHDAAEQAEILQGKLNQLRVGARVTDWTIGPAITRYAVELAPATKVSQVQGHAKDIAVALGTSDVRLVIPIPGRSAIGVEVPNRHREIVHLGDLIPQIPQDAPPLTVPWGKGLTGEPVTADLATGPHWLIVGATNAGKSVCLNVLVTSLLMRCPPEQVRLLLIDPKRVELTGYSGIPHLAAPVVTDPDEAVAVLHWTVEEMTRRLDELAAARVRDITGYNQRHPDRPMPYIVLVIDELADLMLVAGKRVEVAVQRIAQVARAVGIHLVVATQRPSVDVITGVIKANIPSRVAFAVASHTDAGVAGVPGADRLLGRGDMLYLPAGASTPQRVQGAWVSDTEIERVLEHWRAQVTRGLTVPPVTIPTGATSTAAATDTVAAGRQARRSTLAERAATILWQYIAEHPDRFPSTPRRPDGGPWPADAVDGRSGLGPDADETAILEDVAKRELAQAGLDYETVKAQLAEQQLVRRGEGTNIPRKVALIRDGVAGVNGSQPRMLQLLPPVEA